MKGFLLAVTFLVVVLALNARAQIINGVYDSYMAPMDQTENRHLTEYANEPFAGDRENAKPQDRRYEEATKAMDIAGNRHIFILTNQELAPGKHVGLENIEEN